MGLDELREGILEKARQGARTVARDEHDEATRILSDAEAQRKKLLDGARAEASRISAEESREMVANARLEAKRELAKARDDLVAGVEADVKAEFFKAARGRDYEKLLRKLVESARRDIGTDVVVHAAKQDAKLLQGMKGVRVAEKPHECEGGALVVSEDGRVRIDATLEALFQERRDRVRQEISRAVKEE